MPPVDPPTTQPQGNPEAVTPRDNPTGGGQAGGGSEHIYEYGPYDYDDGPQVSGVGARMPGFNPVPPSLPPARNPPRHLPPSVPGADGIAGARGHQYGGAGDRPRQPPPADSDHEPEGGRAMRARYETPPRRPLGSKNLGALREVLYYDPDKEDRGGVSLTDFLESATAALTLGNLEGEDLMQVMPIRLQGAAKTFFRTYLESKGLHLKSPTLGRFWPHFETALKERFHKVTDSVTTLMKLANCRQGEKETVRAYAQRVKAMANQLWPALLQSQNPTSLEAAKTLVYQHFQKGLRPHFLEYLNLKDVTDIETAISVLSKKESFDQTQKERFNGQVNMVSAEMPLRDGAISELNKQMSDLKTTVSAYMAETTALVRGQMDGAAKASHQEQLYDPQVYTEVPYPEYGEIPYHPTIPGSPFTEYGDNSFDQTAPEVPHPTAGGDLYSHTGPDGRQAVPAEYEGDWNPLSDYENSGWVNAVGYQARLPQYPIIRPPMPAGQAQYGPRGGCHYCGGPHAWRQCPRLGYRPAYPAAGVPYQSRFPRPNAAMGYPARPPRPTGAFPRAPCGELRPQCDPGSRITGAGRVRHRTSQPKPSRL